MTTGECLFATIPAWGGLEREVTMGPVSRCLGHSGVGGCSDLVKWMWEEEGGVGVVVVGGGAGGYGTGNGAAVAAAATRFIPALTAAWGWGRYRS